jgi:hypothetical protein
LGLLSASPNAGFSNRLAPKPTVTVSPSGGTLTPSVPLSDGGAAGPDPVGQRLERLDQFAARARGYVEDCKASSRRRRVDDSGLVRAMERDRRQARGRVAGDRLLECPVGQQRVSGATGVVGPFPGRGVRDARHSERSRGADRGSPSPGQELAAIQVHGSVNDPTSPWTSQLVSGARPLRESPR